MRDLLSAMQPLKRPQSSARIQTQVPMNHTHTHTLCLIRHQTAPDALVLCAKDISTKHAQKTQTLRYHQTRDHRIRDTTAHRAHFTHHFVTFDHRRMHVTKNTLRERARDADDDDDDDDRDHPLFTAHKTYRCVDLCVRVR